MLRYTTPAPPVDLAAEVPELAAYTRTTVRLHPKKGRPGVSDSHIGGPLWWPANEPWPTCTEPYLAWVPVVRPDGRHGMRMGPTEAEEPNPLVPIAQLWRRDFPEIDYPDDTDVLQVLWCPDEHDQFDFGGPWSGLCGGIPSLVSRCWIRPLLLGGSPTGYTCHTRVRCIPSGSSSTPVTRCIRRSCKNDFVSGRSPISRPPLTTRDTTKSKSRNTGAAAINTCCRWLPAARSAVGPRGTRPICMTCRVSTVVARQGNC